MLNENTCKVQLCIALEAEGGFWLGGLWKNQGPMHAAEESQHKSCNCSCTRYFDPGESRSPGLPVEVGRRHEK